MRYNIKRIVVLGMLIAVEIVLSRVISIATGTLKFSLAFIPIMIAAVLYGPLWAGVAGAIADIIGAILLPIGAYFPGFTVTAFLAGVTFGVFLYNKKIRWFDASTAAAVVSVAVHMLFNSCILYLYFLTWQDKLTALASIVAAMPNRVIVNAIMIPIQVTAIMFFASVGRRLINSFRDEKANIYRTKARGFFAGKQELRHDISQKIAERCLSMEQYKSAATVFCFVGAEKEIDTKAILEVALTDGKKLCVPRCENEHTMTARWIRSLDELSQKGAFGISEPSPESEIVPPEDIDLVFVPCSAADKKHYRLGKGGRYYDTYLKDTAMFKVALCPEELVVRSLPLKSHDVPVNRVVTENRIY